MSKNARVRFPPADELVEIVEVRPYYTMSAEEKSAVWYHHLDLDSFRSNARADVRKIKHEERNTISMPDSIESCYRGLEFRVSTDRQRKCKHAKIAVLKVQKKIKQLRIINPKNPPDKSLSAILLSRVSRKYSKTARDEAVRCGRRDASSARNSLCIKRALNADISACSLNLDTIFGSYIRSMKRNRDEPLNSGYLKTYGTDFAIFSDYSSPSKRHCVRLSVTNNCTTEVLLSSHREIQASNAMIEPMILINTLILQCRYLDSLSYLGR